MDGQAFWSVNLDQQGDLVEGSYSSSYTGSRSLSYALTDQLGSSRVVFVADIASGNIVVPSRTHSYVHGLTTEIMSSAPVDVRDWRDWRGGFAQGERLRQGALQGRVQRHGLRFFYRLRLLPPGGNQMNLLLHPQRSAHVEVQVHQASDRQHPKAAGGGRKGCRPVPPSRVSRQARTILRFLCLRFKSS